MSNILVVWVFDSLFGVFLQFYLFYREGGGRREEGGGRREEGGGRLKNIFLLQV